MLEVAIQQISRVLNQWMSLPKWLQEFIPIGKQIYMQRSVLGMTLRQLAKRIGSSPSSLVRMEKGEVEPRISTLKKIAEALHCHLLVRLVPKENSEKFLRERAKIIAKQLIDISAASAGLELQKPSKKMIEAEIARLVEEVIQSKRSRLWD